MNKPLSLHQFVTGAMPGNAIYNEAVIMRDALRRWGFRAEIYAERIHPSLRGAARPYTRYRPNGEPVLFHYSLGSRLSDDLLQLSGPLILRYHNVTPPRLMAGMAPWLRDGAAKGRRDLPLFAARTSLALADSAYNQRDLTAAGFERTAVLPLIQPEDLFQAQPAPSFLARFRDGRVNLLFVGRIAPNKRQEDVMKTLYAYRQINPSARLLLAGSEGGAGMYGRWLRRFARQYDLEKDVFFLGQVTQAELAALYRASHIFVCMSEHEGFGNPLVESMRFDLPVMAYAAAAVPETLGGAGILVKEKRYPVIAETIHLLQTDETFRQAVIAGQRERAAAFQQKKLLAQFQTYVSQRHRK
ncbi:MAG TPA: glycosyltransferase [Anaerolineae bacterium]|nr:glycosyltransferase [Anaerolineae bacterium]